MADLACPQCGAPFAFRSADLPVRVCDYCHSAIARDGETLRLVGKAAIVPEDVSPLRLGARGRFDGEAFELVGRVRWRWDDGAWNEWLALGGGGRRFWLGEAMGRFMLLGKVDDPGSLAAAKALVAASARAQRGSEVRLGSVEVSLPSTRRPAAQPAVGQEVEIAGVAYTVADIKQVACIASEGELPSPTIAGTRALSIDLMTPDTRCASIQREGAGGGEDVCVYAGRYVTLADLAMTDLRAFDGWPMPRYAK